MLQIRANFIFLAKLTYVLQFNILYVNIIDVNSKGQVISERNFGVFFPNNSLKWAKKKDKSRGYLMSMHYEFLTKT